jgi:DNA-directed RNA polymerase subunit RPC12/RpoP
VTNLFCLECGERIHRSHSRGFKEKLFKAITSYRTYRCPDCGWRGWFGHGNAFMRRSTLRTIISVLLTLLITALIAFYVVEKLSPIGSAVYIEQRRP